MIDLNLIIVIFKPEIFLVISIIMLLNYKFWFKEQFNNMYPLIFLIYSIISLIITLILVINVGFESVYFTIFVLNLKIYFIKIIILLISISCLILFRNCLIHSETNCLEYFIFYIFTTLIALIAIMFNHFYLSFIALEFLTLCFYILSSFNYNNFGFLLFRLFPYRKLFNISSLVLVLGIFLIEFHNYFVNLFINNRVSSYFNWVDYKEYILICGIILILLSLFIKMIVFHTPTYFIYYQKTPLITIIYMHLIPKIIFFYVIADLIYTNYYFKEYTYYINVLVICLALVCLIISIGMRRLFLKHILEYISLVNSGYLLLCFTPLTFDSLKFCIYFLFVYILVIFFYGGVVLFFDIQEYPGKRISFDTILVGIENKDYCSIVLSTLLFFILGLPPTRRDYPCSRGIPFNGFLCQWFVLGSLLVNQSYLIFSLLTIFNLIIVFFFLGTIIPFWYEKRNLKYSWYPKLNSDLLILILFFFINLIFVLNIDILFIYNFINSFYD